MKPSLEAKQYVKTLKIKDGKFPDVLKWREGLLETLTSQYGEVAKRISIRLNDESSHIDGIKLEDIELDKANYDFTDQGSVAQFNFDKEVAKTKKEPVDKREEINAKILGNVDHQVIKRARLSNPDAFDSRFTPTEVFLEYILSAIYHGDKSEYQKSVRTRLNEYSESPDTTDEEYLDVGRALLMEATALGVPHTEEVLVVTGMKNLCSLWRVVKQEYLIRPNDIDSFDIMEKYLQYMETSQGCYWRSNCVPGAECNY